MTDELKEFIRDNKALSCCMLIAFLGYLGAFICTIIMLMMEL
jgi:hypothetical protein